MGDDRIFSTILRIKSDLPTINRFFNDFTGRALNGFNDDEDFRS